jgi:hypothetical protein
LNIALSGLKEWTPNGAGLLEPVLAAAKARRCPADDILDAYTAANGDARAFVEKIRLKV